MVDQDSESLQKVDIRQRKEETRIDTEDDKSQRWLDQGLKQSIQEGKLLREYSKLLEDFVRRLGADLESIKSMPRNSNEEVDETSAYLVLLSDGLPLLHSQAVYIKALENEVGSMAMKLEHFVDLD